MERVRSHFVEADKFAQHSGIELIDITEGKAVARMAIKECHLNGANVTHGGAIFTLADYAFAAASNSHGVLALAVNVSISFLKPVMLGAVLTAEAEEVSLSSKLGSYTVRVKDQDNELVAIFQGMAYRKKERL